MDKQVIGDRIKLMRERMGWSQRDLANEARRHAPEGKRVTRNSISQYENGHSYPDNWMMQAIADALETSVPFLTGTTDDPSPGPRPTFVAPELWGILESLNDQPPALRRLAVSVLEAAVEYALAYANSDQSQTTAEPVSDLADYPDKSQVSADVAIVTSILTDPERGAKFRQAFAGWLAVEVARQDDNETPPVA